MADSLQRLELAYVDLLLIHWPKPWEDQFVSTWKTFEQLKEEGLVRSIGVSNFKPEHLDRLAAEGLTVPAVNQIQLSPAIVRADQRAYHEAHGIVTESWSPFGGGRSSLFGDPVLTAVGARYGKTPAQVMCRWHLQLGLVVIPKSSDRARMAENLDVFDFELTDADLAEIATLAGPGGVDSDRDGHCSSARYFSAARTYSSATAASTPSSLTRAAYSWAASWASAAASPAWRFDDGAVAAAGLDESVGLEFAVGARDGVRGDAELGRERAHGRQLRARDELTRLDAADHLGFELLEWRVLTLGVDDELHDARGRGTSPADGVGGRLAGLVAHSIVRWMSRESTIALRVWSTLGAIRTFSSASSRLGMSRERMCTMASAEPVTVPASTTSGTPRGCASAPPARPCRGRTARRTPRSRARRRPGRP